MYIAGTAAILLLWDGFISLALVSQYAIETLAPEFAADSPWFRAPLWGASAAARMLGSTII